MPMVQCNAALEGNKENLHDADGIYGSRLHTLYREVEVQGLHW